MEEIIIFEYQAKQIEDTFRKVANVLKSRTKETCLDRDVMQSIEYIKNVINKEPTKRVYR